MYVLKSRGTAHSNQVREFLITSRGVRLVDAYLGEEGVLTGSARLSQLNRERTPSGWWPKKKRNASNWPSRTGARPWRRKSSRCARDLWQSRRSSRGSRPAANSGTKQIELDRQAMAKSRRASQKLKGEL